MRFPAPSRTRCLLGLALVGLGIFAAPAGAQTEPAPDEPRFGEEAGRIDVVQVDGLLDPANAALLERVVREVSEADSSLLVVQLDATGAVDVDIDALVDLFENATIPIGVWVGPSGGNARGASALLALERADRVDGVTRRDRARLPVELRQQRPAA